MKSMTAATVGGVSGDTFLDGHHDSGAPTVTSRSRVKKGIDNQLERSGLSKSSAVEAALTQALLGQSAARPGQGVESRQPALDRPRSVRPGSPSQAAGPPSDPAPQHASPECPVRALPADSR